MGIDVVRGLVGGGGVVAAEKQDSQYYVLDTQTTCTDV